jgi:hypothetical protein
MYILSRTMIEITDTNGEKNLELATLPEMFTDFLGTLLLIIYIGIILLGLSFIPNILMKRSYFLILISASIIFLTLVALAFSFGMSKITELSVGPLNGSGILEILLTDGSIKYINSSWGLGSGFYLCVISSAILVSAGLIDYLRRRIEKKKSFSKK